MATWKGHLMNVSNKFSISFRLNETHKIQACVRLPFLFILGMPHWDPDNNHLTFHNCSFYTCLNSTISFNQEKQSLHILKARNGVRMPVIMDRSWQHSPEMFLIDEILKYVLHRIRWFIALLVTVVLGIIAITATAATAGFTRHQTVQTTHFIQNWHQDSERLWNVGPKEFNKNPLPLDKQSKTNSILCYTYHLMYNPHMTYLLLKTLPHPSQATEHTLTGNRLI